MQFKKSILKVKLIVAASENNVIGVKNDLPWHLPDDMNFFKSKTKNSVVIMGKNNYLSIPEKFRPLKNRINIILTKNSSFSAQGCIISSSIEHALKIAQQHNKNIFIIGGGIVYKEALEKQLIDVIYLTRIHAHIKGDTFFPTINMNNWKEINSVFHKKDKKHKFNFTFFKFEKIY